MQEIKTHELALTNGAVLVLKSVLPSQGWYEGSPISIPIAANDINERLSDIKQPKQEASDEQLVEWDRKTYTLSGVTEKQREAMKRCVSFYLKKATLPIINSTAVLINELGLSEE